MRGEEGRGGEGEGREGGRETEWSGSRRRPSRAQPRPVCNLPNDLSPGLIITVVPSPTKQSGGILFKNNCVPSCDGFLCLITANCSEFTSIMARLTRRLCNTGECGREKKKEETERARCRPAGNCNSCARSSSEKSATRDANRPPSVFSRPTLRGTLLFSPCLLKRG